MLGGGKKDVRVAKDDDVSEKKERDLRLKRYQRGQLAIRKEREGRRKTKIRQ